ncbi:MAG: DUF3105 domain-containing protein [Polyangiaceae bacterium]|nr:DUF3105 domain-containing protein [Polyangiaceae bacterium]
MLDGRSLFASRAAPRIGLAASSIALFLWLAACGDSSTDGGGGQGAGGDGAGGEGGSEPEPVETVLHPDQPPLPGETECVVTIWDHLPFEGQTHVGVCTDVAYQTNPPSSGNHWPIWAQFRTYDAPVPRPMLVHDLEHGAVIMSHRCDPACPDVVAAFQQAAAAFGIDELCVNTSAGAVSQRIIITPDPLLDEPIALSAWRSTYTATCIDPPSLLDFIEQHYAQGPENLCALGKDPADPETGVPGCEL